MMLGSIGFAGTVIPAAGPCAVASGALVLGALAIAVIILVVADLRSAS